MDFEREILEIKERNKRVEMEKAWETSLFRKCSILVITYILATLLMYILGVEKPYLSSLVPTLGFFLSTLSLDFLKKLWASKIYKE